MDPIFLAEIGIVGLIIVVQFAVFFRNLGSIRKLGKLFPEAHTLAVEETQDTESPVFSQQAIPQLRDHPSFTESFRSIVSMTTQVFFRRGIY